jgi:hypothetical protein
MRLLLLALLLSFTAYAQNVSAPVFICTSASVSSIAYTCSPAPFSTYATAKNIPVSWTPDVSNTTTTPTLNLGAGPLNLKDVNGNPVLIGAAVAASVYIVAYDGINIRILSGPVNNTPPTVSDCGTSPTITGTNRAGTVREGTSATGCTITFSAPYLMVPGCTVTAQAEHRFTYTVTTSAIKIVNIGALSGTILNYACPQ